MPDGMDAGTVAAAAGAVSVGMSSVAADYTAAAVLLVDLDTRTVVYANALARQLAPQSDLPLDINAWSEAAGLQDAGGQPLGKGMSTLSRVAAGDPVKGEQVTARRGSDAAGPREDLWVIGMPLLDAPEPLNRRALVAFLPLTDEAGVFAMQQRGFALQHRAVVASSVSFSISDPARPDDPLVWVNPAFEATTGYRSADVLGTNCRFLQGPATDRDAVARIRDGLRSGQAVTETLLNYRADGTAFWNHVVISPIFDNAGTLTHHVGVQSDVTQRVDADRERDRALELARAAHWRQTALAAISAELAGGLDTGQTTLARLPAVIATHFDGWVICVGLAEAGRADFADETGGRRDWVADTTGTAVIGEIAVARSGDAPVPDHDLAASVSAWVDTVTGAATVGGLLARLGTGPLTFTATTGFLTQLADATGLAVADVNGFRDGAVAVTAITARGRQIGLLGLLRNPAAGPFEPVQMASVADLGVRVGLSLDNARLYQREHDASLLLQRSLAPQLPDLDGFEIAAAYQPARNHDEVGGDWYDVLDLTEGRGIGVAVGDVMGHDLRAAAAMGEVRSLLRAFAWSGDKPASVIARTSELVRAQHTTTLATCAYLLLQRSPTGRCDVFYTLAGHPPPLIKQPDGRVTRLDGAVTAPLGVATDLATDLATAQAETDLAVGAHLILYTDGLVERRTDAATVPDHLGSDITDNIDLFSRQIADADPTLTADQMCRYILDNMSDPDQQDDTCVLVLRRLF